MPNPAKGFLQIHEDMVKVLLVLEMFLAKILRLKICSVMTLPALKNPCSSAMVFFRLQLQSVQYDLQHDFAWVTDEAYC